ncbi:hypothetical protein V6U78_00290 [Marinospirillum sp. MEB164]|uniref:Peptidase S1 n=1 Tax=Marinospirillum alkalitolerans TaxID=3123374 RepID=A0ABW8PT56_9GAMM
MKKKFKKTAWALAAAASLALVSTQAAAQEPNWRAVPTYTTVDLRAGFMPDPWTISIQAGGAMQTPSRLGHDCRGYIHGQAPDVDLNYTAGSLNLYIHVESRADTTLVINAPDGRWYCNDDTIGLNPMVMFSNPRSGNYNIWVGTYSSGSLEPATLLITELDPRR